MGAIGETLSSSGLGFSMPNMGVLGKYALIFLIAFFVIIIGVGIGYYIIMVLRFKYKIRVFSKVGNKIQQIIYDKAMFERIGSAGDYWCITKKGKKRLPIPSIQMDKNEFWFFQRADGEWINIGLEDLNEKAEDLKIQSVDQDMRLQRLAINKLLETRYDKQSFWEKYGVMILNTLFVIVVLIAFIVIAQKMVEAHAQMQSTASAISEMAEAVYQLSQRIGGGVTTA